jgi:cation diffusion facilitator CzcD-associated flavoprotein CzcO
MQDSTDKNAAPNFDPEALRRKYLEERAKRLRPDAAAQYQTLTGKFAHLAEDPHADPGFTREPVHDEIDVLIIGGGLSGLTTAARLRHENIQSIRIIEKGADFGGTWYWNRYPGAACDVESYIYLPLLEDLDYIPSEKYAKAPEIYEYCRMMARRYDLYRTALLQTAVTGLRWDAKVERWIASTNRGDHIAARFAIVAPGILSQPKLPGIPGIDTFAGHSFHTSRWDYKYTGGNERGGLVGLAGKRVGVIGTGATAIQCVPQVARYAEHLYVFQRTPSSVDARNNVPTGADFKRLLTPGWHRRRMINFNNLVSGIPEKEDLVADGWTDILADLGFVLSSKNGPPDPQKLELALLAKMEKCRQRIGGIVKNAATAEALKPYYHYLCKRPCFSDEYLQTFNRDNVTLVDTAGKGVERITPSGAVVAGKEYPVDCLIFATGFEWLSEFAGQIGYEIYGRGGLALSERWSQGTRTLHGMLTHGFPNLFILGLAQNGVPPNLTHLIDERAIHLAYLLKRCINEDVCTIDCSQEAEDRWVGEIIAQRGLRRAFLEACTPSYYNQEGRDTPATSLNDIYGAGSVAFFKLLEEWRAQDALEGLEVTRQERSSTDQLVPVAAHSTD